LELGVDETALDRVHGPCGLDIGAGTTAETAVAVVAEIVAVRAGRTGGSLRDRDTPIHAEVAPAA
jgi:xanthine dehydrogenase accessory factor